MLELVSGGGGSSGSYTPLDASALVPTTSRRVRFEGRENNGKESHFRPGGSSVADAAHFLPEHKQTLVSAMACSSSQVIEYETDDGEVFVSIIGYEDEL